MLNRKTALRLAATTSALAISVSSAAMAASTGSTTLTMTGTMEDVCVIEFDQHTATADAGINNVAYMATQNADGAFDNATLTFEFDVAETADPSETAIGQISAGHVEFEMDVYCNDQFTTNLSSANGGLLNAGAATGGDALFSNEVEYTVDYTLGNNTSAGNASNDIQGGTNIDVAAVPTSDDTGSLAIDWTGGDHLLAGAYVDTLVLTVTAN